MKFRLVLFFLFLVITVKAQIDDRPPAKADVGFGIGVDYGGFGGRVTYLPAPKFGLFAGLGYNLAGAGFNAGGILRFSPEKRVVPTLTAMYGYNAVLVITGAIEVSKIYYGPSFGGGIQIKSKRNSRNFFNIELLLPIRPDEFESDQNFYKSLGVEISEPLPVSFSLAYHIGF
jgi:hypothetical protein